VSPILAAMSLAALAGLAAAGVLAGFLRRDPVPVEAPTDPLEDRWLALRRSGDDLESAYRDGALEEPEYRRLRADTDARLARVRRELVVRERRAVEQAGVVVRRGARVPTWAVGVLLAATVLSVAVVGLLRSSQTPPPATVAVDGSDPFAFFEERVRQHPDDLAARLDLAHRYLDAERYDEALAEYAVALELDPDDAEANANVGLILFVVGRHQEALDSVDRALETAPNYPEALLYRGLILLRGLDRAGEAIVALEGYLDAAPFGAERDTAEDLIAEAEAALASSS
jgi:cytochrome c-type biogenesis protein CcmH/NrfG